ncbi:MAG: hypothetical protein U1E27_12495, partial [Kiritimatiellia bacterium]|nr:hypothetical protein [Kiritimatiellia bacterium]
MNPLPVSSRIPVAILLGSLLFGASPQARSKTPPVYEPDLRYRAELDYGTRRLVAVPSFHNVSVYFKPDPIRETDLWRIEIRENRDDAPWLEGHPPIFARTDGLLRGSLVDLQEDTEYEVRLLRTPGPDDREPGEIFSTDFRTWTSHPP